MKTKFQSVQTANPGSGWATLPNVGCSEFTIKNDNSVDVDLRRVDDTENIHPLKSNTGLAGIRCANLNEYQVRRTDSNNAQVTLQIAYDA